MPIEVYIFVFKIFIVSLFEQTQVWLGTCRKPRLTFFQLNYLEMQLTQLTQLIPACNFKIEKSAVYFFNYNILETQKNHLKPTFIFSNPANSAKTSS